MNETLEAIRTEWRNGGLERCLAGEDYTPANACDEHGKIIPWNWSGRKQDFKPSEDAILRSNYPNGGTAACLEGCPSFTKSQIKRRANYLGLHTSVRGCTR